MIIVLLCTVSAIKYTIPELISSEDFYTGKDTVAYWADGKIQITGSKNREGENEIKSHRKQIYAKTYICQKSCFGGGNDSAF